MYQHVAGGAIQHVSPTCTNCSSPPVHTNTPLTHPTSCTCCVCRLLLVNFACCIASPIGLTGGWWRREGLHSDRALTANVPVPTRPHYLQASTRAY